jgi:hypothetical protein
VCMWDVYCSIWYIYLSSNVILRNSLSRVKFTIRVQRVTITTSRFPHKFYSCIMHFLTINHHTFPVLH